MNSKLIITLFCCVIASCFAKQLLGGWSPIPNDDEGAINAARVNIQKAFRLTHRLIKFAASAIGDELCGSNLGASLAQVYQAERQLVAGFNVRNILNCYLDKV